MPWANFVIKLGCQIGLNTYRRPREIPISQLFVLKDNENAVTACLAKNRYAHNRSQVPRFRGRRIRGSRWGDMRYVTCHVLHAALCWDAQSSSRYTRQPLTTLPFVLFRILHYLKARISRITMLQTSKNRTGVSAACSFSTAMRWAKALGEDTR